MRPKTAGPAPALSFWGQNRQMETDLTKAEPDACFDIERMERALAGPRYLIPDGMTVEEIVRFLDEESERLAQVLERGRMG